MNAFNKLARTNNTLILPANVGDISSLVGQAMSIYTTISKQNNNASIVDTPSPVVELNDKTEKNP